jgi:iron-sulfur cluster assembly accessory protein
MSVERFDPKTMGAASVEVTEAARVHLEAQVAKSGQSAVRLGVKESGCNGYMYELNYLDVPTDEDLPVPTGGNLKLYVRRSDLPLVGGTRVDFVREGLNASLKFKNPNAESHCGCGESFALQAAEG